MSWISQIFKSKKNLINELEAAKEALKDCNGKLVEKQEHINKTNAYWKNKLRENKIPSRKKKDL
jgi:peptidoglycan hydrolase CwlO-like protein